MIKQDPLTATSPDPIQPDPSARYTKQAWLLIWAWGIFIALCLLIQGGRLLGLLFPAGSFGVGVFLYYRTPDLYVGYAWWMLFLSSLIRRIIDQQSGFINPGRWGLTGMLVACISLITVARCLPKVYRNDTSLAFIFSLLGIVYAFLVGIVLGRRGLPYMVVLFEWLAPVVFGFHLFLNWHQYPRLRQVIEQSFNWGVLVMGLYGVFQFFVAPSWERFYLDKGGALSFGTPEPLGIRVFSTLGSPQSFATVMMAGLLLLFGSQTKLRFVASGAGYLSFLLSAARSAWVGWLAGVLAFIPFIRPKFQMRFLVTVLMMAILVVPIVSLEPFSEGITQRLESFLNAQDDVSLQGRSEGYQDALSLALSEVTGGGLGSAGPATALGGGDSGILPLFFSFGWVGVIPYAGGLLMLMLKLLQTKDKGRDVFSSAARAIALGTFAQIWLNNIFSDAFGLVLWGFLGIGLAAQQYNAHQRSLR